MTLKQKIHGLWLFPFHISVWQNLDQERGNQNAQIYLKITLPHNKCRYLTWFTNTNYYILFTCREWPNPVLLKNITSPSENKVGLNFPVWDPRVNMQIIIIWNSSCSLVLLDYPIDFQRVQQLIMGILKPCYLCTVPLILSFIL